MTNQLSIDIFIFMQILFALFTITEHDFIKAQMDIDRAKLSKYKFRATWAGRTVFLLIPSFTIISLLYNPL